jgi:hypothetical protein
MRLATPFLALLITLPLAAQNVEGCGVTTIASVCESETMARISTNDCLDGPTGRLFDVYEFAGTAGQFLNLTLRPLSSNLREPQLALAAPPPDSIRPPSIILGEGQSIWYRLTSSGNWRLAVSSQNATATGDYVLHTKCFPDEDPTAPAACTYQDLLCNQVGSWNLSDQSCRYDNGQRYNSWLIWGVEGDQITLDMASTSFTEQMELVDLDGDVLARSNLVGNGARIVYRFPRTDWFFIDTHGTTTGARGNYSLTAQCASSGCLFPHFTADIADLRVERGTAATVTFNVDAVGAWRAYLLDASGAVVATSTTNTLQTPAVNGAATYRVKVENECGDDESNAFTVGPDATKRRVVRH